jgi:hypothetical protein
MSVASIIFNQSQQRVTLQSLSSILGEFGVASTMGEWRYLTESVPQLEVAISPPLALQLNDHPDVRAEHAELLEEEIAELSPEDPCVST